MEAVLEPLLLVHRLLGYATVLFIGPAVLLTWRRLDRHARWGKAYCFAMLLLYLTGTPRTFYFQAWGSWGLARNFTFNFFGIVQVLIGYRAVRQWKNDERRTVDTLLAWLFRANAVAMIAVGLRDLPVLLMGWFALAVAACDAYELRRSPADPRVHMRRHLRHMFGSYYYLLTVLSIVHLPLGHDWKWLWCGAFGLAVWLLSRLGGLRLLPRWRGGPAWSVRGALAANVALGLYVVGHAMHDGYQVAPSPPTFEQKLAAQQERFEFAQRSWLEHHRDGRPLDRSRWEALLQPPASFRLSDDEQRRLRHDQRRRIEARAAATRRESRFDLDRLRHGPRLREFCRLLPKGGMLHVHPTGTLHPATVQSLLERVNPAVGWERLPRRDAFAESEIAFLHAYPGSVRFRDLSADDRRRFGRLFTMPPGTDDFARFDAVFALVGRLNADPQFDALAQICDDFFARAAEHRVSYVEFTTSVAPQPEQIERWERLAERAENRFGITLRINVAFNRAAQESDNFAHLQALVALLRERPSPVVVGIDLLGAERNRPAFEAGRRLYAELLSGPGEPPLRRTLHAAGLGDVRNVRDAILLGAERIGHGTRWPDDPTVLEFAVRRRLPVEVNLLSNVRLGYVSELRTHPFLDLLRLGLRVSLSTDDEGIFETDLSHEFAYAVAETDVTYAEVKQLVYHSLETAFVDEARRTSLLGRLDADFRRFEEYELPRLFEAADAAVAERTGTKVR